MIELKDEKFEILSRKKSSSSNFIISTCHLLEFEPIINNEVIEPSTLLAFVSANHSVCIVPEDFAKIRLSGIKLIKLKDYISADICAIYDNKQKNPIAFEFIEYMRSRRFSR